MEERLASMDSPLPLLVHGIASFQQPSNEQNSPANQQVKGPRIGCSDAACQLPNSLVFDELDGIFS